MSDWTVIQAAGALVKREQSSGVTLPSLSRAVEVNEMAPGPSQAHVSGLPRFSERAMFSIIHDTFSVLSPHFFLIPPECLKCLTVIKKGLYNNAYSITIPALPTIVLR